MPNARPNVSPETVYATPDSYVPAAYATRSFLRDLSWSAVFAGVILSIITYLILSTLGAAIGAGTINPLYQQNPFHGLGVGAAVWLGISAVIAILVGGYTAGRFAPNEGGAHGLLAWAVVTLIATYFLISLAASAVSMAGNAIGKGAELAGSGIAAAAPSVANGIKDQLQQNGVSPDWDGMKDQLNTLLQQTGKPSLAPSNLAATADQAKADAKGAATDAAQQPANANDDLAAWLQKVKQNAQPVLADADRDALANIIAARTGKSKEESQQIADNYAKTYADTMAKFQQLKQQAEQKAREAGDAAAAAVAKTAWGAFALLIIGVVLSFTAGEMGFKSFRRTI